MFRWLLVLPLTGCIIYDSEGKCRHCDGDGWSGDTAGLVDDDTAGGGGDDTSGDDAAEHAFTLTPDEASPGEVVITSLTVEGEFDLATIEDLEFVGGDVSVCATSSRDAELLVTISVAAEATFGPVDLLLYLPDGQVELVNDALDIVDPNAPSDEGTDADGDGVPDDQGGSTDDGSGSTDDGGGSTDGGGGSTGDGGGSADDGGGC